MGRARVPGEGGREAQRVTWEQGGEQRLLELGNCPVLRQPMTARGTVSLGAGLGSRPGERPNQSMEVSTLKGEATQPRSKMFCGSRSDGSLLLTLQMWPVRPAVLSCSPEAQPSLKQGSPRRPLSAQ